MADKQKEIVKVMKRFVVSCISLFIVFCVFSLLYVNHGKRKQISFDRDKAIEFVQRYREAKSHGWTQSDTIFSKDVADKFEDEQFVSMVSDRPRKYVVLKDNFSAKSCEKRDDLVDPWGHNCYTVTGEEVIIGYVVEGKLQMLEDPKIFFPVKYSIVVTGYDKFKVIMDAMHGDWYILEKDVPLLLNRLNTEK